jgi:hypothetical protein
MKRLSLLGAATIVTAAVLVSTSGAASTDPHVVKFDGIVKASDIVLTDVKGDGPGPGDIYTFTATGYDKTGQQKLSTGHGYCVFGAPKFATCTTVSNDGKGKIVLSWEDNGNSNGADQVAITGGTRKYRTIRGDGSVKQASASDPTTFRLKLNGNTR